MTATTEPLNVSSLDRRTRNRHFIFTDEHDQLRESIRTFAKRELAPHAEEWEEATFPDSAMRRMGELGLLGLDKPEEYGGQGGDYYSAIVLAEELTHSNCGGLALAVAVQTDMAMPPILAFGTEAQKREWAVPAIAGQKILCLGITEPDTGSDVVNIKTRARRDGDDWIINGSKTYITNGLRADVIVLVAKTDPDAGYRGISLFLVPMDAPGVIREQKLDKLGMRASDTALLAFQDVRVPATAMLGEQGLGFYNIMWELQGERLIGATHAVATAERLFEQTLEYAKQRNAFGQSIGSFQVIRQKFGTMSMNLEAAKSYLYSTAWQIVNGTYPVRDVSASKVLAVRTACDVADECIQIHGGAGYMREYGIERAWRDLRLHRIGAGTDEILLDVVGKSFGL